MEGGEGWDVRDGDIGIAVVGVARSLYVGWAGEGGRGGMGAGGGGAP